jgi:hypothetical protein
MKNYIDIDGRVFRTHCTRCGKQLPFVSHSKQFRGVTVHVTEIMITQIENRPPYEFGSVETLCNACKEEFLSVFNTFMKKAITGSIYGAANG